MKQERSEENIWDFNNACHLGYILVKYEKDDLLPDYCSISNVRESLLFAFECIGFNVVRQKEIISWASFLGIGKGHWKIWEVTNNELLKKFSSEFPQSEGNTIPNYYHTKKREKVSLDWK